MEWMLDIQLVRRNLSPIQRIAVAEKYRPIYERQAKENISKSVSESNKNRVNPALVNLPNMGRKIESVNTSEKLASIADVSEKTYRMGAKILQSDDELFSQNSSKTVCESIDVRNNFEVKDVGDRIAGEYSLELNMRGICYCRIGDCS